MHQPPDLGRARRLLIVKLSAIGDVVHALPVAAALKRSFPNLAIDWVAEPLAAPLLQHCPAIDQIVVTAKRRRSERFKAKALRETLEMGHRLRATGYDVALDLQGLTKSALLTALSGAPRRYGYDWIRELAPLFERRIPRAEASLHVVDQLLDVAAFLGADISNPAFPLTLTAAEMEEARAALSGVGIDAAQRFAVCNPTEGGGTGQKGWAPDRMAEAVRRLQAEDGLPVVLVGSPADKEIADRLCAAHAPAPASLVGRTSLRQLAAVIRLAAVHLSGDTGSSHIAAAVGVPAVTVFGRSNPDRVCPYGYRQYVVHHREACHDVCRRFHETGAINTTQKCLADSPRCMGAIETGEVVMMVRRALADRYNRG